MSWFSYKIKWRPVPAQRAGKENQSIYKKYFTHPFGLTYCLNLNLLIFLVASLNTRRAIKPLIWSLIICLLNDSVLYDFDIKTLLFWEVSHLPSQNNFNAQCYVIRDCWDRRTDRWTDQAQVHLFWCAFAAKKGINSKRSNMSSNQLIKMNDIFWLKS